MPQYVEVHETLLGDPKMVRLARLLSARPVHLQGHLSALWLWMLKYAANGDLTHLDPLDIATGADWDGDPEVFVRALTDCGMGGKPGFLRRTEGGLLIWHNWHLYGGKIVLTRFCDTYRKRHGKQPTPAEIEAAGLFPHGMMPSGQPQNTPFPAGNDDGFPSGKAEATPSNGFQKIPADSAGFRRRTAERSVDKRSVEQQQHSGAGIPAEPVGGSVRASRPAAAVPFANASEESGPPPEGIGADLDASQIADALVAEGVNRSDAQRLARSSPDECLRQLEYLPHRAVKESRGGLLVRAISDGWDPPKEFQAAKERETENQRRKEAKAARRAREEAKRAEEAAVSAEIERLRGDEPDVWQAISDAARDSLDQHLRERPDSRATLQVIANRCRETVRGRLGYSARNNGGNNNGAGPAQPPQEAQ